MTNTWNASLHLSTRLEWNAYKDFSFDYLKKSQKQVRSWKGTENDFQWNLCISHGYL